MASVEELRSNIIKGCEQGRSRLAAISHVMAPATQALLDRFERLAGAFSTVSINGAVGERPLLGAEADIIRRCYSYITPGS